MTSGSLIDTNIAIHLRDLDDEAVARVAAMPTRPFLSVVSHVELEGGVVREPALRAFRRARTDAIVRNLVIFDFLDAERLAYRRIVEAVGYSRTRVLDRMIAATALVRDMTLITMNGADFRDIPGLRLEVWPAPGNPAP